MQNLENLDVFEILITQKLLKCLKDPFLRSALIGFPINTGPDPLKNHKATKPEFNFGHHRHANEKPFKWIFAGGPMMPT